MTAVGLGQQGSQAVGPGSSLCRAKYFYDFTDFCPEISETLKGSPKNFSELRQRIFDGNSWYYSPPSYP